MIGNHLLTIKQMTKTYSRNGRRIAAVNDVSFQIGRGETLALAGPSGSGKSTIARLLLRLIEPDAGSIHFEGQDFLALKGAALRERRRKLQMVFQDPLAAFNPRATVARVLDDPLRIHAIVPRGERNDRIATLMERVGLDPGLQPRSIHEISGGQRQRVAIARALATEPSMIVLDEAVSALDPSVRRKILDLLLGLQEQEQIAYLFISHDLAVARAFAHRIAIIDHGRIAEEGSARQLVDAPQSEIGKALVAAIPTLPSRM